MPPTLEQIGHTMDSLHASLVASGSIQALRDELARLIQGSLDTKHLVPADDITERFFEAIDGIRKKSESDIAAALKGDPAAKDATEVMLYYPGFRATLLHRIANTLHTLGVPYLPRGITEYAHRITGIDIHPGATIGEGFFIDHGTGVVIGETTHIGNEVTLYQGVTLGAKSFKHDVNGKVIREEKRHPTIEDRVVIYANATVLGGRTVIGRDSIIGGGVWLMESIEPGSRVMLTPPEITQKP